MKLTIKNMVCNHCVEAVVRALSSQGLEVLSAEIGRAEIEGEYSGERLQQIVETLKEAGFELISDPINDLVENIKREIIALVRSEEPVEENISSYLERRLHKSYKALSAAFSSVEGRTIETYVTLQRIERVKELLIDGQLTVSEIAYKTGFANVGHLSRRFKTFTGMTPSEFRVSGHRTPIIEI